MDKMKELYEKVAKDGNLQAKFAEIMEEAPFRYRAGCSSRRKINAWKLGSCRFDTESHDSLRSGVGFKWTRLQ